MVVVNGTKSLVENNANYENKSKNKGAWFLDVSQQIIEYYKKVSGMHFLVNNVVPGLPLNSIICLWVRLNEPLINVNKIYENWIQLYQIMEANSRLGRMQDLNDKTLVDTWMIIKSKDLKLVLEILKND